MLSSFFIIASVAWSKSSPSNSPELKVTPCSTDASFETSGSLPSAFFMTGITGRPYFLAKSQSLWSCAGTLITAPVP